MATSSRFQHKTAETAIHNTTKYSFFNEKKYIISKEGFGALTHLDAIPVLREIANARLRLLHEIFIITVKISCKSLKNRFQWGL
jgi:hypothetical protein